jgi:hypothetical protein
VDHKAPHRFLLLLVSWVALASRFAASSSSGWRRRAEIKVVLLLQLEAVSSKQIKNLKTTKAG